MRTLTLLFFCFSLGCYAAEETVEELKARCADLSQTVTMQKAELAALTLQIQVLKAELERKAPEASEEDAKAVLLAKIMDQSEERIRLVEFKKVNGQAALAGQYIVSFTAKMQILENCFWGPAAPIWNGDFYTAVGNPNDLQYLSPPYVGKIRAKRGDFVAFWGKLHLAKTEQGWKGDLVESRIADLTARPIIERDSNTPPQFGSVTKASTEKRQITKQNRAEGPLPVGDYLNKSNSSGPKTTWWISNGTLSMVQIFVNGTEDLKLVPFATGAYETPIGASVQVKAVSKKGTYETVYKVDREKPTLKLTNADFKK